MEMLIRLIHTIVGFAFLLYIPGYAATLVLFKKDEITSIERITLAIGLSIFIDVFVGFILGFSKTFASLTGGITGLNVWICLLLITAVLYLVGRKNARG